MPLRTLVLIAVFPVVFIAGAASVCCSAESDPALKEAKAAFLREMKKKAPAARAEAVLALSEVAHPETAELILKRGLPDGDASVRPAVQKALRKFVDDRATQTYLFDE